MPTAVRKKHLALLEPYILGEQPSIRGEDEHREYDMFCPLHEDSNRSATLDIDKGLWYCHKGCGGGPVGQLIRMKDEWLDPPASGSRSRSSSNGNGNGSNGDPAEEITEAKVKGWMQSLISSPAELEELMAARSLEPEILTAYEIGWDRDRKAYTIPVRGEEEEIWNLRRYQLNPPNGRRKIWSVKNMGTPRLYPMSVLTEDDPDEIIICEGEWDALLTIQQGFPAVTRTASAGTWDASWGPYFKGKTVYLIHDMDDAGLNANRKVARALKHIADVRIVELPYERTPDHGKDLTDYWQDGHDEEDFRALLESAKAADADEDLSSSEPDDATVLDTFDAGRVGRPLRVPVTVKGKRDPGYTVPSKFTLNCTRDAGQKCKVCPLNSAGGSGELSVKPHDPLVLELMESTKGQVNAAAAGAYGVPGGKCPRLEIEVVEHQAVEILFARPSVDHSDGSSDYKNMKITSVGRHDTQPNNTFRVVGALHPDPRKQTNEFLAWEVTPVKTSLDTFELSEADAKRLRKFRPRKGQRPLKKLGNIARDLEAHVTKIYGRAEMHAAMDLVFHSALAFDFSGQRIERGWLDALIVGDTRTGKSEAATQLVRHYSAGEVVLCESASFAGIVGGLQQYGGGKEWAINWGAIPLNDRRLVVLDEVSGLPTDKIAEMSDVRSRGVAQLTKIQTEATHARTRLLWIGNPRDASMANFTYGVQAIKPLIGNPEDIARFDLAMSASESDVPPEEINRVHEREEQEFTADICSMLVRWVWSRTPDQIVWAKGAEAAVYEAASQLGKRYVADPPLVQGANVRIKIARMAVALAARLFSTDETHECIMVRKEHVWDAVAFLDRIYNMPGFGYAEWSREKIGDRQEARAKREHVLQYLRGRQGLAKFLRSSATFRRQDVEEIMNVGREDANAIINTLWEARMVRKDRGDVRVEPALHELLREVKH